MRVTLFNPSRAQLDAVTVLGADVSTEPLADLLMACPDVWVDPDCDSEDELLLETIEELEPWMVAVEMPRGFASPRFEGWLHYWIDDLSDIGYRVAYDVRRVGRAKRVVIVGILEDDARIPNPRPSVGQEAMAAQFWVELARSNGFVADSTRR